jgi:hypothetical protein
VRKPEGKRLLPILRHKWEHGIKIDLKETGWEGVDWRWGPVWGLL